VLRAGVVALIAPEACNAWHELDAKLRAFIERRVRACDVSDVVQDVFVRMQRGIHAVADHERFGPWVYRVARSAIADHVRRAARHPLSADPLHDEAVLAEDDDRGVEQQMATYVAWFVAMLPSPYREALTLTELEGLTQKEAAAMLGISLSGMKSRVQRGRERLRRSLEDCCEIALDARGKVTSCEPRPDGKLPDACCDIEGSDRDE
jgi:RNA polymerase sigma-70 factor (ECF subfamily)